MGGMRFGMLPQMTSPSSSHPRMASNENSRTVEAPSPPARAVPSEPQMQHLEYEEALSDDGVKVEAAESEMSMEEVTAEDAEEEPEDVPPPPPPPRDNRTISPPAAAPPPPSRTGRPPVPTASPPSPPPKSDSQRPELRHAPTSTGEFVMVDNQDEAVPPPPPRARPSHSRSSGPPPLPSKQASGAAWELPEIPSGSFDLSGGFKMDSSVTSEDSTTYPPPISSSPPPPPPPPAREPSREAPTPTPSRLVAPPTQEELIHLASTIGRQVQLAAAALYDKSKKNVVGDGTSQGFVDAALAQVPQASRASHGHLIYSQTGNTVTKRMSNILPGDIIELTEAKLKGHKGLQSYHQSAGTAREPLVAVVSEFDTKKSKVKVFQANQHVGSQTVEMVSYRLDDLKSGTAKIFRVASA
ncbi:hypothetical protein M422DRAFT_250988 [Sphaerobolus stellatus SS14]|uniref:BBC1/AIM3 cysteine proteinase-fold domain-containing protein n=1 Tax=Sphaerobolus stellatus (strain SS14) TaxID=990650 RepID=A0A0C9W3D8_SPHS4|nr:hypothetical protein M422DRAFT_250988 [Sphaerobolus stellatus SS14]